MPTTLQIIRLNRNFFVVTRELFSLQLKPIIHSRPKPVVSESSGDFFLFERLGHAINQLPLFGEFVKPALLQTIKMMLNLPPP